MRSPNGNMMPRGFQPKVLIATTLAMRSTRVLAAVRAGQAAEVVEHERDVVQVELEQGVAEADHVVDDLEAPQR